MQSVAFKLTPRPDFTIAASALSPGACLAKRCGHLHGDHRSP